MTVLFGFYYKDSAFSVSGLWFLDRTVRLVHRIIWKILRPILKIETVHLDISDFEKMKKPVRLKEPVLWYTLWKLFLGMALGMSGSDGAKCRKGASANFV